MTASFRLLSVGSPILGKLLVYISVTQLVGFVREIVIGSFESGWSIMGIKEGMMGKRFESDILIGYEKGGKESIKGK